MTPTCLALGDQLKGEYLSYVSIISVVLTGIMATIHLALFPKRITLSIVLNYYVLKKMFKRIHQWRVAITVDTLLPKRIHQ